MGKIIGLFLKEVADGKMGPIAAKVYWKLAGYKTWVGVVLAVAAYTLDTLSAAGLCSGCANYSKAVYFVSAFLVSIGFVDGALRTTSPQEKK